MLWLWSRSRRSACAGNVTLSWSLCKLVSFSWHLSASDGNVMQSMAGSAGYFVTLASRVRGQDADYQNWNRATDMVIDEQHYSHKMYFVLLWLSAPRSILNQVKFISSVGGEIRGWFVKFFQANICVWLNVKHLPPLWYLACVCRRLLYYRAWGSPAAGQCGLWGKPCQP